MFIGIAGPRDHRDPAIPRLSPLAGLRSASTCLTKVKDGSIRPHAYNDAIFQFAFFHLQQHYHRPRPLEQTSSDNIKDIRTMLYIGSLGTRQTRCYAQSWCTMALFTALGTLILTCSFFHLLAYISHRQPAYRIVVRDRIAIAAAQVLSSTSLSTRPGYKYCLHLDLIPVPLCYTNTIPDHPHRPYAHTVSQTIHSSARQQHTIQPDLRSAAIAAYGHNRPYSSRAHIRPRD